ncbi:MAG: hypothetical protein ABL903_16960 [Methylococcales bacterium]
MSLFCDGLFWASQPNQAAKTTATGFMPPAALTVSCTSIARDPARGSLQSTLQLIRETDCLFPRLMLNRISLGKLKLTCAYQRLKIFTSLTLRFHDFQRTHPLAKAK